MLCKMLFFSANASNLREEKSPSSASLSRFTILIMCAATLGNNNNKKNQPQCDVTKGTSRASDGAVSQVLACERSNEASARENVEGQRAEDAASLNRSWRQAAPLGWENEHLMKRMDVRSLKQSIIQQMQLSD